LGDFFYKVNRIFHRFQEFLDSIDVDNDLNRKPIPWSKRKMFPFVIMPLVLKGVSDHERITSINGPEYAGRFFQRPATEVMSNIIDFHNDLMMVVVFISIFIFVLLSVCLYNYATVNYAEFYSSNDKVSRSNHNTAAEIIFTVVPAIIVFSIAAPSFALLYTNNDWLEKETELTVSITGHQ